MPSFNRVKPQTPRVVILYFGIAFVIIGAIWLADRSLLTGAEAVVISFVLPCERIALEYFLLPPGKRLAPFYSASIAFIALLALCWVWTQPRFLTSNPAPAVAALGALAVGPVYLAVKSLQLLASAQQQPRQ